MEFAELDKLYVGEISHGETYPNEVTWLPGDSLELYNQHKASPTHAELLAKHGWDKDPERLTYYHNAQGFRDHRDFNEIDPKTACRLAIGCSVTYGEGVMYADTFPSVLERTTGVPTYNLGLPGRGLEAYFRVLSYWLPRLQPDMVYLQKTSTYRREVFNDDMNDLTGFEPIGAWSIDDNPDNPKGDIPMKIRLLSDYDVYLNAKRSLFAIESLCRQNNTELRIIDDWKYISNINKIASFGRDLQHPGKDWHRQVAQLFEEAGKPDLSDEDLYYSHTRSKGSKVSIRNRLEKLWGRDTKL